MVLSGEQFSITKLICPAGPKGRAGCKQLKRNQHPMLVLVPTKKTPCKSDSACSYSAITVSIHPIKMPIYPDQTVIMTSEIMETNAKQDNPRENKLYRFIYKYFWKCVSLYIYFEN